MAYRWLGVLLMSAACATAAGCGSDGNGGPRGGTGGDGTGGVGGNSGTGGTGGTIQCTTNLLCRSCPSDGLCTTDDDCAAGSVCIDSGCGLDGVAMLHCVFAGGGACVNNDGCPAERECLEVPGEGMRCVKTTPGCASDFDCVLGFTCENGDCVDRRVPCDLDVHCPKSHVCGGTPNSSFCRRVHRECEADFDCDGLAPRCEDIDGDGSKECAGTLDPNDPGSDACLNLACMDPSVPVCELAGAGSTTLCGEYGLCRDDDDCADNFICAALWPDGRKECVPTGGDCSSFEQCPVRQVCASARDGGAPSCQEGFQP